MISRFFRRAISWNDLAAGAALVAPTPGGAAIDPPEPQWNIAPSALCPILKPSRPGLYEGDYAPDGRVMLLPAFWGLIPSWVRAQGFNDKPFSSFTARADVIETSPAFSGAYAHGRCLVPASGFYAWDAGAPFAVGLRSRHWFCFAGLWSRVLLEGSEIDTFAVITCPANALTAPFGESMPAILAPGHHKRWLDPAAHDPAALLRPYPADDMRLWPAHPAVGNVRNQGPELLGEPQDS